MFTCIPQDMESIISVSVQFEITSSGVDKLYLKIKFSVIKNKN
jgi:hypothetical protein